MSEPPGNTHWAAPLVGYVFTWAKKRIGRTQSGRQSSHLTHKEERRVAELPMADVALAGGVNGA